MHSPRSAVHQELDVKPYCNFERHAHVGDTIVSCPTKKTSEESVIYIGTYHYPTIDLTLSDSDTSLDEKPKSFLTEEQRTPVYNNSVRQAPLFSRTLGYFSRSPRLLKSTSAINFPTSQEVNSFHSINKAWSSRCVVLKNNLVKRKNCKVLRDISVLDLPPELIVPDVSSEFEVEERTKLNAYDHKVLDNFLDFEEDYQLNDIAFTEPKSLYTQENLTSARLLTTDCGNLEDTCETYLSNSLGE